MKFTIAANEVTLETAGTKVSVPFAAFSASQRAGLQVPTGILPPAVRWISSHGTALLWERPPESGRFTYYNRTNEASHAFLLPRPWMLYAFQFSPEFDNVLSLRIYARNGPFYSAHDPLFMMPLPNIYNNAMACLGQDFGSAYRTWAQAQGSELTVASALLYAQGLFWSMDANDEVPTWINPWRLPLELPADLRGGLDESHVYNNDLAVAILARFEHWSRADMANASFGASNSFADAGDTVGLLCEYLQDAENKLLHVNDPWAQLTHAFNTARQLTVPDLEASTQ